MTSIHTVVAMLKKASLVGAFFIALQTGAHASTTLCSVKKPPAQLVVHSIIDGDTIRLADDRRVRLIGMNAPEMGGCGRSAEPYAVKAKRRLSALIKANNGKVGLLVGEQKRDRYGRVLAHLYDRHGANLEAQLVSEGLAYHVVVAPNVALADCLAQVEQQARQQRLGLWAKAQFTPAQQLNTGGFTLLEGRIQTVQRNRGGVWLELGHSVSVNIPKSALQYFKPEQFEQWRGRKLNTRGWVSERKGQLKKYAKWRVTVSHPSMLELQ